MPNQLWKKGCRSFFEPPARLSSSCKTISAAETLLQKTIWKKPYIFFPLCCILFSRHGYIYVFFAGKGQKTLSLLLESLSLTHLQSPEHTNCSLRFFVFEVLFSMALRFLILFSTLPASVIAALRNFLEIVSLGRVIIDHLSDGLFSLSGKG